MQITFDVSNKEELKVVSSLLSTMVEFEEKIQDYVPDAEDHDAEQLAEAPAEAPAKEAPAPLKAVKARPVNEPEPEPAAAPAAEVPTLEATQALAKSKIASAENGLAKIKALLAEYEVGGISDLSDAKRGELYEKISAIG